MKKQNAYGNYLVRNRRYYCFRINVPLDLQRYVGRSELRRSLGIRHLAEARELSNRIARKISQLFQRLRKETNKLPQLSEEKIQEIINTCIKETLESYDRRLYEDNCREEDLSRVNTIEEYHNYISLLDDIREDMIVKMNMVMEVGGQLAAFLYPIAKICLTQ